MVRLEMSFKADSLGMHTQVVALLPDGLKPGERIPSLTLLHGLSDDHTMWSRRTSVERYASAYRMAVVMPNGHRSFYTDLPSGEKFFTYITEELPERMRGLFPISGRREDTFIAGLSMGGYGAFKAALNRPDVYGAAASFSGALDVEGRADFVESPLGIAVFGSGEAAVRRPHNLLLLCDDLGKDPAKCPKLYQTCGTEDFLYQRNLTFRDRALANKLPLTYVERPGTHEWGFWDQSIQDTLAWLPVAKA